MSMWDTRISGSDEFYEVHEEFFDRYKDGVTAEEVYRDILAEYAAEFEDEQEDCDHILMHEVCFALAWCLWECGCRDEWLWQKIKGIIESGENLKYGWVDDPKVVRSRERELKKFWQRINTPAKKIRLPKKDRPPRKPSLHKGDLYAYPVEGGFRVALVLDFIEYGGFLTAISEEIFPDVPDEAAAMQAHTHTVSWFESRQSIPKKERKLIANLGIHASYNNRAGLVRIENEMFGCSSIGERGYFFDLEQAQPEMKRNRIGRYVLRDLLAPDVLPKYHDRMP